MNHFSDPYLQGDGLTLKNRLGIKHDPKGLDDALSRRSADRIAELRDGEIDIPQTFDAAHLRALHATIFGDVFEWAGHFRSDSPVIEGEVARPIRTMRKAGSAVTFTPANRIETELERLSQGLKRNDFLRGLPRATFARKAARVFADLNTIHPFREGNGRVQREFMDQLARQAGHQIDFTVVSQERMYAASEHATAGDRKPMERLMDEITDPARTGKLRKLTDFFDREEFDWNGHYVSTTTPGEKYRGSFGGGAGTDFFMISENRIIAGNFADVPAGTRQGQDVVITATPIGDQKPVKSRAAGPERKPPAKDEDER